VTGAGAASRLGVLGALAMLPVLDGASAIA
jgi:hypothetical protein